MMRCWPPWHMKVLTLSTKAGQRKRCSTHMGWEIRNNKPHYYSKQRRGNQVVSVYHGAGLLGQLAAALDERDRQQRQQTIADRLAISRPIAWTAELQAFEDTVKALVDQALTRAGYRQHHRGEWRKRRTMKKPPMHELTALAERANAPDATDADRAALRSCYAEYPELAASLGDLAPLVIMRLLDQHVPEYSSQEAIGRKLAALRRELSGPAPTPLECLLVEQIVICYLRLQIAESAYTAATFTTAEHYEKRLSATQKRYLRSIETLARVRRLLKLPAVQVNVAIGGQQANLQG